MRSVRLFAVAVLAVVLALASVQGAFATITSVSMEPGCGPPGTTVELHVTATAQFSVLFDPEPEDLSCRYNSEGVTMDCVFTVPEGVHKTTITIVEQQGASRVLTFGDCPAAVGGVAEPVSMVALVSPWLALIGLVGCIGTIVVVSKKR